MSYTLTTLEFPTHNFDFHLVICLLLKLFNANSKMENTMSGSFVACG